MKAQRLLLILFFLIPALWLSPCNANAPTGVVVDMLLRGNTPMGDFQSVTIPLKQAGRLFLIEARIDGQEGNLVFDTGAEGLVLNRTYFRNYTGMPQASAGGVTGSAGDVRNTVVGRVDVSGLYYENVEADMVNLGHIEDRRGVKILGLFGLGLISDLEVVFDARNSELRLNRTDKKGNRTDKEGNLLLNDANDREFEFTHDIETINNLVIIKAMVSNKELNFCLDTGAEINVMHYALPKKVMNTVEINRRSDLGGSGAGTVKAVYGVMSELEFGTHQFGKMDVAVINLSSMCDAYDCNIHGMLGYDFWQKGVFCINFKKKVISFNIAKGNQQ